MLYKALKIISGTTNMQMEQTINSNNNVFHINNFIVIYFKNNIRRDK